MRGVCVALYLFGWFAVGGCIGSAFWLVCVLVCSCFDVVYLLLVCLVCCFHFAFVVLLVVFGCLLRGLVCLA